VQAEEDWYAPKEPSRGTTGKGLGDYEALAIVLDLAACGSFKWKRDNNQTLPILD
jgi:hypothetical protein